MPKEQTIIETLKAQRNAAADDVVMYKAELLYQLATVTEQNVRIKELEAAVAAKPDVRNKQKPALRTTETEGSA